MQATALEFAPNTTEHCQKIVFGMFEPGRLLRAYRAACLEHKTKDIVMICPDQNPDNLSAGPRESYMKGWLERYGGKGAIFSCSESAHKKVKLPQEMDAFWLVIHLPQLEIPITVVMFAAPYERTSAGAFS